MARVCHPHAIVIYNLLLTILSHNFSPGQLRKKKIFRLGRSIIYFVEAPEIDVCHIFFKILDNIILKQLRQGLIFDMLCSLFVVYYWLFHCPEKNKQRGEVG